MICLNLEYPGQCYDGKRAYNMGIHYPENKCMRLSCDENFILQFATLVFIKILRKMLKIFDNTCVLHTF